MAMYRTTRAPTHLGFQVGVDCLALGHHGPQVGVLQATVAHSIQLARQHHRVPHPHTQAPQVTRKAVNVNIQRNSRPSRVGPAIPKGRVGGLQARPYARQVRKRKDTDGKRLPGSIKNGWTDPDSDSSGHDGRE